MIKTAKWLFFALWLLCIVGFVIGQLAAPPEYHLLPNNYWGNFFGACVILGVLFFFVMAICISKDGKAIKSRRKKSENKYNFSIKRIISRLLLTFMVGIIFGISMIPFLTDTKGLLYEQRAAIGNQNMIRMVVLWAIFTLVVSLYAFWKKHFRMVSVLLIICWFLSLAFLLVQGMFRANNYRCRRANPYPMPKEFNRSLDLIAQRMGVDETAGGTVWQSVFNFRNCLNIQYLETGDDGPEGYFEYPLELNQKNLQDLKIFVDSSYQNFDDLTLASLLSHEIVHAAQYINEVVSKTQLTCYEKEADAFTAQHWFILSLNEEEQRSIYARLRENSAKNPTFQTIILTSQRANESTQTCTDLQKKNNLTEEQKNKCSWDGLKSKLLKDIQENPYYQEQCAK